MPQKTFHLIGPVEVLAVATTVAAASAFAQAQSPAQAPPEDAPPAVPAAAADGPTAPGGRMYRWVDKNNTVHYSDRPQPGAASVAVQAPQTYTPPRVAAPPAGSRAGSGSPGRSPPPPSCGITSPAADEVFPNAQSVMISYRGPTGGVAELQLSGTLNETRRLPAGQAFTLTPVPRGTYTARVSISSEPGVAPCLTPPVTFHVTQPSLLSPVRQQMNRPQPRAN